MYSEEINNIADSLKTTANAHSEGGTGWIMHHIMDSRTLDFEPFSIPLPQIHLFGLDISITKHIVFMWIAFAILVLIFRLVAKSYKNHYCQKDSLMLWK